MPYLTEFITVAVVSQLAIMSPGPDFAIVTKNALLYDRRIGMYTGLGICLGCLVHVLYCLVGIGLVISNSPLLYNAIRYMGAAYLVYIGIMSLKCPSSHSMNQANSGRQSMAYYTAIWQGFLTNLLNPKATLFFLSLFSQIVDSTTPKGIQFLFGMTNVVLVFIWFTLISFTFAQRTVQQRLEGLHGYIERVMGLVLIVLGIGIVLN